MKRIIHIVPMVGLVMALSSCATGSTSEYAIGPPYYYAQPELGYSSASGPMAGEPAQMGWPRIIVSGSTTNLIYEPQVDSWNGRQLRARDGVAMQSAGQSQSAFGVVTLQAITLVDKTTRTVALENIQILSGNFPYAPQQAQIYLQTLRRTFPRELGGLSLDRLELSFAVAPQQLRGSGEPLNNAPPKIIFDTKPAILVYIDGQPAYRLVAGTSLQRVINTGVLLLKDPSGQFYLHVLDGYMEAPSLAGPWTVAGERPRGAAQAERQATVSGTPADLLLGRTDSPANQPPAFTESTAPGIYVSTTPAELILFDGEPAFVRIPGTHLLYAANTTGNVFKLSSEQRTYVLISGRWFGAPSLGGPWVFVPADHLPPDFANIPDNSPKENVKASVPGTRQATEALIDNNIPESTKVPRRTQMQDPQIDGPPQLEPIAGTALFYVVNSGTPIIEVEARSWYACQNGVWYAATSPNGPWTVAVSVPSVIYSIPPDSPLHYLTYVQVYGATPQEVYEGYTPGYLGAEVEDGLVVYGTGYDYAPWIGAVWYGWPCTWGLGWGPCWTPWDDWCFDFGFGWGCGFGGLGWRRCHPPGPWWGPCRDWHREGGQMAWRRSDTASTAGNVYARLGARRGASLLSTTAGAALPTGYGRAYNSRTGRLTAGQGAGVPGEYRALLSRAEMSGYWGLGPFATRGGNGHFGLWGETRPGYFTGGRYSHGESHNGGYSHAGWGSRGGWGGSHGARGGGGGFGGGHGGGGGGHR